MSSQQTFVERCLAGDADLSEIDQYVDIWHKGLDPRELHDFLGLRWEEYQLWVERPESLPFILASRKYHIPLSDALKPSEGFAAAARAGTPAEAGRVLAWLKQTGRL